MRRAWLLCLSLLAVPAFALDVPPHTGLVIDQTQTLSSSEVQQLEASLQQFQRERGPQIQVLIIPELKDETVETYSIKVADAWKLGDAKRDDGILLLIAKADRKLRIEVGQGLEGAIPDAKAGRIIDQVIVPYFKEGRFSDGIFAGVQAIAQDLGSNLSNVPVSSAPRRSYRSPMSSHWSTFLLVIFVLSILSGFGRRRRRSGLIDGILLGTLLGGSRSGRGDGFFGGGGGGFSGGGGGGFSGGGSSGRW